MQVKQTKSIKLLITISISSSRNVLIKNTGYTHRVHEISEHQVSAIFAAHPQDVLAANVHRYPKQQGRMS